MNAPRTTATKYSQERLMTVLLAPVISEKATQIADKHDQVVFRVAPDATRSSSPLPDCTTTATHSSTPPGNPAPSA